MVYLARVVYHTKRVHPERRVCSVKRVYLASRVYHTRRVHPTRRVSNDQIQFARSSTSKV